ncbi:MAG: HDOD domain-containing protein [bacterium]|nr:HDOD domain-containing protein [bacterium]
MTGERRRLPNWASGCSRSSARRLRSSARGACHRDRSRGSTCSLIGAEDPDFADIATQIQGDATVSFRLLTYLNSASFNLTDRVNSISQAISLLGWRRVAPGCGKVPLSDTARPPPRPTCCAWPRSAPGSLEVIASRYSFWGFDPGEHAPARAVLAAGRRWACRCRKWSVSPLDSSLKAALRGEQNSEYRRCSSWCGPGGRRWPTSMLPRAA